MWLGINGFGRIGKLLTRQALTGTQLNVVAINDPHMTTQQMGCALQNDSTHGRFEGEVTVSPDHKTLYIKMDDPSDSLVRSIACHHNELGNDIPWASVGVDYVVECSGKINNDAQAQIHLRSASKLIMSHPPNDATDVFVPGVNTMKYVPHTKVLSCASCTTNALAPLLHVVDRVFGIEQAMFTTVHAVTPSNKMLDCAGQKGVLDNIVPATTGASRALVRVLPQLDGKVSGMAVRVPTSNVSMIDVNCTLTNKCTKEALGAAIAGAAQEHMKGIIDLCTHNTVNPFPTASKDYCHDSRYVRACCAAEFCSHGFYLITCACTYSPTPPPHAHTHRSCIVDLNSCLFSEDEKFVKLIAYYDNEWAYASRLLDLCVFVNEQDQLHPDAPLMLPPVNKCPIMAPQA